MINLIPLILISFVSSSSKKFRDASSNGFCGKNHVKSSVGQCIPLDFIQSNPKPLCIDSKGWMNQGGCEGQCYNPNGASVECQDKDADGIGICRINQSNSWKICCPIGHKLNANSECQSQLTYHNGTIMKNKLFDTGLYNLFIGDWNKDHRKLIGKFEQRLEDSKWIDILDKYYMKKSNGEKRFATNGFERLRSPTFSMQSTIFNRSYFKGFVKHYLNTSLFSSDPDSIYVVFVRFLMI